MGLHHAYIKVLPVFVVLGCGEPDAPVPPESDIDKDGYTLEEGDCDDTDAALNLDDVDGDGQTTCGGDCDDTDATLNGTDADDDGLSSCEGDCDDTDAGKGDSAQDADCDGVKTDEDCDDTDGLLGTCWTTLSLGHEHSCALRSSGEAYCWGDNGSGQSDVPEHRFRALSAGHYHTCGIDTTGTLRCWGANGQGQSSPPEGLYHAVSVGDGPPAP